MSATAAAPAATSTYETTILVNVNDARADYEGTLANVRATYEGEGAQFIELEKWEERSLAYPIKGQKQALYLFGYFSAPTGAIEKIERRANLGGVILRQLIISRPGKDLEQIRTQRAKAAAAAVAAAQAAAAAAAVAAANPVPAFAART
jgi:ribosomal protein S6